jgi:VIT1/CCC1 family predicted Fe2+/Mn2+ transporter
MAKKKTMLQPKMLTRKQIERIIGFQQNEIDEYHIYRKLASRMKDVKNKKTLQSIAEGERRHYQFWKKHSNVELKSRGLRVFYYYLIMRIFGITFGIKLMEHGESRAQGTYSDFANVIPDSKQIAKDEEEHEDKLMAMLREERLEYVGSIVLGLNDALVELTGALAGFSLALPKPQLIAGIGLITGIAASLSMAASEYLSTKAEGSNTAEALRSSLYTGVTYIVTVILLVLPFFLFESALLCLAITVGVAVLIIFLFNYYISVARDLNFGKRFLEMVGISLGVAAVSFGIGYLVRLFFNT